jgi:hypothetical protein
MISLRMTHTCVAMLLFISGSAVARSQQLPWDNLVGIKNLDKQFTVHLDLQGAEEFDLSANRVQQILVRRFEDAKLVGTGATLKPRADVFISGYPTGGGGGSWTVEMTLTASVSSPFAKDHKIQAIVWRAQKSDQQIMSYDPDKKKVQHPVTALSKRVETTVSEVAELLIQDLKKANLKQ